MPPAGSLSEIEHYERADVHKGFECTLTENSHGEAPGWRVTTIFYSALHVVSAYLARQGMYPKDHPERGKMLAKDHKGRTISSSYETLQGWSKASRYELGGISDAQIAAAHLILAKIESALK
mgnify:CR=1 FL=1